MTPRTRSEQTPQADAAEAQAEQGFIEYSGYPPYGTEFDDHRVISRKDAKDAWDVTIPKDLRWTKDRKGRMRLPLADVPVEVRDLLLEDKAFKVVEE